MRFMLKALILLCLVISKGSAEAPSPSVKSTTETTKNSATEPKPAVTLLPEISLGDKKAPVVVIDYSSLTCTHCADFFLTVLPQIKTKYIDPGKVRIVFRGFPGDALSLQAEQLAWCRGTMKYMAIVKMLYENQEKWLTAANPELELKSLIAQNGISTQQIDSCLKDQELTDQILQIRQDAQEYNIKATPTFVFNGITIHSGFLSLEEFASFIAPFLPEAEQIEEQSESKKTHKQKSSKK